MAVLLFSTVLVDASRVTKIEHEGRVYCEVFYPRTLTCDPASVLTSHAKGDAMCKTLHATLADLPAEVVCVLVGVA